MWIYILIIIVLLYALYKERQALGCGNFLDGKDCDNANGKAVKGSAPSPKDSCDQLLDKIDYAADYQSRFVKWRAFLILSFLGMLLLWFAVFQKFPSEWELVVGMLVLFLVMSSASSFYKFHLYNHIEHNIDESTEILRQRYSSGDCGPGTSSTDGFGFARPYPY